jgi:hypothetical protein
MLTLRASAGTAYSLIPGASIATTDHHELVRAQPGLHTLARGCTSARDAAQPARMRCLRCGTGPGGPRAGVVNFRRTWFAGDCHGRRRLGLRCSGMQHARFLLVITVTGCATTSSVGVQAVSAPHRDGSVEATVAGGFGFATESSALLARGEGTLGAARDGVQGRVQASDEFVSFGQKMGWQLRAGVGASFGAYQSPDATFQVSGGPHFNLDRTDLPSSLRVISVALDAAIGVALRPAESHASPGLDGRFLGLGLSLRRDQVTDPGIKGLKWWSGTRQ